MKIQLTVQHHQELKSLLTIVKNKQHAPGIRRLARSRFEFLIKNMKKSS